MLRLRGAVLFSGTGVGSQRALFSIGKRFWAKETYIEGADISSADPVVAVAGLVRSFNWRALDFPKSQMGFVLLHSAQIIVPVHNGQLQPQHSLSLAKALGTVAIASSYLKVSESRSPNCTVCGYFARSMSDDESTATCSIYDDIIPKYVVTSQDSKSTTQSSVVVPLSAGERPVDPERLRELNAALLAIADVSGDDLLTKEMYALSPALKIYKSFVAPRQRCAAGSANSGRTNNGSVDSISGKGNVISNGRGQSGGQSEDRPSLQTRMMLEPVARAAKRTALQIQHVIRQIQADEARYLRNTDASIGGGGGGMVKTGTATSDAVTFKNENDYSNSISSNANNRVDSEPHSGKRLVIVLDNLRSAHNVGSIFRSAETAGAHEVLTVGITAHPPNNPKLQKSALGATDYVRHRHFDSVIAAVSSLKQEGYTIIAAETTSMSQHYSAAAYGDKVAIVFGNETTGVDTRVMESFADLLVEIPTFGHKNSLNVAAAAPVIMFEVIRKWNANK